MIMPNVLIILKENFLHQIKSDVFALTYPPPWDGQTLPNLKQNKAYYFTRLSEDRIYHIESLPRVQEQTGIYSLQMKIGNAFVYRQPPLTQGEIDELTETHRFHTYRYLKRFGLHQIAPGLCFPIPVENNAHNVHPFETVGEA